MLSRYAFCHVACSPCRSQTFGYSKGPILHIAKLHAPSWCSQHLKSCDNSQPVHVFKETEEHANSVFKYSANRSHDDALVVFLKGSGSLLQFNKGLMMIKHRWEKFCHIQLQPYTKAQQSIYTRSERGMRANLIRKWLTRRASPVY